MQIMTIIHNQIKKQYSVGNVFQISIKALSRLTAKKKTPSFEGENLVEKILPKWKNEHYK
jgi:hypothetical protein